MNIQSLGKYLLVCLACLYSIFAPAQDQFLIYSMKGKVSVVTNNSNNRVRTGTLLTATSQVNVPAGGAVTFICKEGGLFSITRKGSFTLDSLRDSCITKNNILFTNYSKFVWDQLTIPTNEKGRNRRHYFPNYEENRR